jgi:hypothetical protein
MSKYAQSENNNEELNNSHESDSFHESDESSASMLHYNFLTILLFIY